MKKHLWASILLLILVCALPLAPCTLMVVGKQATVDGSLINSHTDTCNNSRIMVVPGRHYPKGAMAPVYFGILDPKRPLNDFGEIIGYIPQAETTYTYIHSGYSHINEYQLSIAESTTSQRTELQVERPAAKQIMSVEQAMIFALQRCKKSRQAVQLITSLMERYGFLPTTGPESETLCVADPDEAWILEICSVGPAWQPGSTKPGAIWAAQRLADDHAAIVPNWSIIREIDLAKPEWFMASANYKQEAIDRGWYNPANGKPFVWQEAYAPIAHEWATSRFWLFYSTLAPHFCEWPQRTLTSPYGGLDSYHQYVEPLSIYPFSVKPEKKISLQDIMALQRSTFEGTIYDMAANPVWYIPNGSGGMTKSPMTTPFPTKSLRELLRIPWRRNVSRGNYGMIAQLRGWLPASIGGIYWVYLDNQYTGIYVPIRAGVQTISPLYSTYDPDKFSEESARWVYDFVDNLLYLKWQEAINDLRAVRDPLENGFIAQAAETDRRAMELQRKDPKQAAKFLTDDARHCIEAAVQAYRDLRYQLISKYTNNKQGS